MAPMRVVQPRGDAVDPPKEFSWLPVRGAGSYRVRIADEDAVWPLFVKTVSEPKLVLDPKEVTAITPGRIHEWAVEALDAKGHVIARGGSRFRYMPVAGSSPSPGAEATPQAPGNPGGN